MLIVRDVRDGTLVLVFFWFTYSQTAVVVIVLYWCSCFGDHCCCCCSFVAAVLIHTPKNIEGIVIPASNCEATMYYYLFSRFEPNVRHHVFLFFFLSSSTRARLRPFFRATWPTAGTWPRAIVMLVFNAGYFTYSHCFSEFYLSFFLLWTLAACFRGYGDCRSTKKKTILRSNKTLHLPLVVGLINPWY